MDENYKLPEGKTCGDCATFNGCHNLFGIAATLTECYAAPCRFRSERRQTPTPKPDRIPPADFPTRIAQFHAGVFGHAPSFAAGELVNDLWTEVERLRADLASQANAKTASGLNTGGKPHQP